jgi:ribonuclease VapC
MVIDTSAFIAILRDEPEAAHFRRLVLAGSVRLVASVMARLEASMVAIGRRGQPGLVELDRLFAELAVTFIAFDEHQADIARDAFARYGKGRHPAGLNFGDCAAYALAMAEAEPLLFKGTDFGATDVQVASAT